MNSPVKIKVSIDINGMVEDVVAEIPWENIEN